MGSSDTRLIEDASVVSRRRRVTIVVTALWMAAAYGFTFLCVARPFNGTSGMVSKGVPAKPSARLLYASGNNTVNCYWGAVFRPAVFVANCFTPTEWVDDSTGFMLGDPLITYLWNRR